MRRLGSPNRMPTPAAKKPEMKKMAMMSSPGHAVVILKAEYAPTAMKPPVPSESWPAKPVSRLSPSAASAKIRNGIRIACSQYSFANVGTAKRGEQRDHGHEDRVDGAAAGREEAPAGVGEISAHGHTRSRNWNSNILIQSCFFPLVLAAIASSGASPSGSCRRPDGCWHVSNPNTQALQRSCDCVSSSAAARARAQTWNVPLLRE